MINKIQKTLVKVYCPKCKRQHVLDVTNGNADSCICKCSSKIEAFFFFGQEVLINSTIQLPDNKHIVLVGKAKHYSLSKVAETYAYYSNDIMTDYAYIHYDNRTSDIIYGYIAYKIIQDEVAYILYEDGTVELLEKSA